MSKAPIGSERFSALGAGVANASRMSETPSAYYDHRSRQKLHSNNPFEEASNNIQDNTISFDTDDDDIVLDVLAQLAGAPADSTGANSMDSDALISHNTSAPTDVARTLNRKSSGTASGQDTPTGMVLGGGGATSSAAHSVVSSFQAGTSARETPSRTQSLPQLLHVPSSYSGGAAMGSVPPPPNYAESLASAERASMVLHPASAAMYATSATTAVPDGDGGVMVTPPANSLPSTMMGTPHVMAQQPKQQQQPQPPPPHQQATATTTAAFPQMATAPGVAGGAFVQYNPQLGAYTVVQAPTTAAVQQAQAMAQAIPIQQQQQQQQQQYVFMQQPSGQRLIYVPQPPPQQQRHPPSYPQQAIQQQHVPQQQQQMTNVIFPVQMSDGTTSTQTYQVPSQYTTNIPLLQQYISSLQQQQQQQQAQQQSQTQPMVYMNGQLYHIAQLPQGVSTTAAAAPQPPAQQVVDIHGQTYVVATAGAGQPPPPPPQLVQSSPSAMQYMYQKPQYRF